MKAKELSMGLRDIEFGIVALAIAAILLAIYSSRALAQSGEVDYRHYCASCHGLNGKGRGTWNGTPVPDLTQLRRKNGGKFPFEDVYRVVDGRSKWPWHQRRPDMPYWGQVFEEEGKEPAVKAKVEARIAAIVDYIRNLQEK
jgi:mono/diheme cytochrome c family protein